VLDATYHSFLLYSSCPLLDKKMKSFLAIALCLAASAFAQTPLMVNTPEEVVSCQPVKVTWTGTGPFTLSVFPFPIDGQAPIIVFKTNANSVVWLVNVPANSELVLILLDGNGNTAESAGFTVRDGSSTCTGTSFSFGSTTATGPTSAGSPASVTPATSPTASSLGSFNKQSGASSPTSTASTTATPKSGASRVTGQFAAAGIMGAAMVALLG